MIDFEFQIRMLERELAHYKEMQQLVRSHVEAHDASIAALSSRLDRVEANLEELSQLTVLIGKQLSQLIDSLSGRGNGAGKP